MSRAKKWEWNSTGSVQARILDAAMRIFTKKGYSESTLADIVTESNASVGSIYHHFNGGKDALFTALANGFREELAERLGPDPGEGWERAYLEAVWERRDTFLLLVSPDSPPSHSPADRALDFFANELGVLENDGGPLAPTLIGILIQAGTFIAQLNDREEAERIIAAAHKWCQAVMLVGYHG